MKVIGVDPGTTRCGYSIIERTGDRKSGGSNQLVALDYGIIDVRGAKLLEEQLYMIHEELVRLINSYRPDSLALERLYFNRNVKTALAVGAARGAIILTAKMLRLEIFEYQPQQIKAAVTGYGNASKEQVQRMVQCLLALPELPEPDDVADALATGICHLFSASALLMLDTADRLAGEESFSGRGPKILTTSALMKSAREVEAGYAAAVRRALELEEKKQRIKTVRQGDSDSKRKR